MSPLSRRQFLEDSMVAAAAAAAGTAISAPAVAQEPKDAASREADEAASGDKTRLIELGIEATVEIWVERWRTRRVEEHDEREQVGEFVSPRRTERVEMAQ